jgi:peptidoglycan/LPS O-acetylase OafA/YrhL
VKVSLSRRLDDTQGRPTGFDYMRIALAVGVVAWHSIGTSYGPQGENAVLASVFRPIPATIVPAFFALSGFLVAGSLLRTKTLGMFLGLRAIRIFPALIVEVVLSAILLGAVLTTLPLAEYFGSTTFWRYFLNIPGHIQYRLPGVFLSNPQPETVNGQLWTVPFELYCYIGIAVLAVLGLHRRPRLFALATAGLALFGAFHWFRKHGWSLENPLTGMPGYTLVICFLVGALIYLERDRIPWSRPLFYACGTASIVLLSFPPLGDVLAIAPLSYCTVYLGLCNPRKAAVLHGADYSYGLFLYGYAIQQAIMSFGPPVQHWYWNILLALPIATGVAALSWHWVEKPALQNRKHLERIERRYLAWRNAPRPQRLPILTVHRDHTAKDHQPQQRS